MSGSRTFRSGKYMVNPVVYRRKIVPALGLAAWKSRF